jgi:peptidoglycan hydrolase-like protein with peptidoglycan-binding domain
MNDSARIHTPDIPLGRLIRMPGGKNVGQALEDAEKGLQSLRGESMKELQRVLEKAGDYYSRAEGKFNPLLVNAFYDLINGAIGLPTVGKPIAPLIRS